MKNRSLCGLLAVALGFAAGAVQAAGDPAKGAQKNSMCEGCHGIPGYRTAFPKVYSVPKLGGQQAPYIVLALQAYQSGARKHPSMNGIAQALSAQDMEDLAAFYSQQK
jgi:cytochrome c553